MELGDAVKKLTEKCGVKPCTGCEKRARALNRFGRRGFIGNLALLAIAGRSFGRSVLGMPEQATVAEAILYVRRLNAAEVRFNTINGRYTESVAELELPEPPAGWSLDAHAKDDDWTVLLTQDGHDAVVIYSNSSGIIRKGVLSAEALHPEALPAIYEAESSLWERFSGRALPQGGCFGCTGAPCQGTCTNTPSQIPKLACFYNCSCCDGCGWCYTAATKNGTFCCSIDCGLSYGGCSCNGNCHCTACQ
jgi:hypothetical protein